MDNVLILDKLDELSARFDDKIGQIDTILDSQGQEISNVSYNTELLTGQQEYTLIAQASSYPAYVVCNSAIGEYKVNYTTGMKYLYKFKTKLTGQITILFSGSTDATTTCLSSTNYVIQNLTNGSRNLDLRLYANTTGSNTTTFKYEDNIVLLKNNEYAIAIEPTNSGTQTINVTTCNIYAAIEITAKTISNQIVEIN